MNLSRKLMRRVIGLFSGKAPALPPAPPTYGPLILPASSYDDRLAEAMKNNEAKSNQALELLRSPFATMESPFITSTRPTAQGRAEELTELSEKLKTNAVSGNSHIASLTSALDAMRIENDALIEARDLLLEENARNKARIGELETELASRSLLD